MKCLAAWLAFYKASSIMGLVHSPPLIAPITPPFFQRGVRCRNYGASQSSRPIRTFASSTAAGPVLVKHVSVE